MGLSGLCHAIAAQVCICLASSICSTLILSLGGSNVPSSHSSTILPAQGVMAPPSLGARPLLPMTKWPVEQRGPNYISAPVLIARPLKDFLDIAKFGRCSSLEEEERENMPTVSACCVVLPVPECAGCGTVKTMSGLRFTASINGDGFTSTLVRKYGTTQGSTQRVSIFS